VGKLKTSIDNASSASPTNSHHYFVTVASYELAPMTMMWTAGGAAARRAARLLGVPIRTGRGPDGGAWAALDRPLSDVDLEEAAAALDRAFSHTRAEQHRGVRESPPDRPSAPGANPR